MHRGRTARVRERLEPRDEGSRIVATTISSSEALRRLVG
jgi:hypothetical protein